MKRLVIDCGGTYIRSQIWNDDQMAEEFSSLKRPLLEYIHECFERHDNIQKILISYAGQVENGIIFSAPNIQIDEANLSERLIARYGVEVWIDNDLNCAALAEADRLQCNTIAVLYAGTGLGAAVIDHGKIIRGAHNMAYELGHTPYKKSDSLCGCGRDNCLELFASGSGISKRLKRLQYSENWSLESLKNSLGNEERQIALDFEDALIHGCGVLVTLANPSIFVLGGGIVLNNPYLLELVRAKLENVALPASLNDLRIEMSRFENGSLAGAKLLEYVHET